jgi:hypothetical protein
MYSYARMYNLLVVSPLFSRSCVKSCYVIPMTPIHSNIGEAVTSSSVLGVSQPPSPSSPNYPSFLAHRINVVKWAITGDDMRVVIKG